MKIWTIFLTLGVSFLYVAGCNEDSGYYDYVAFSYIDTVLAGDTIQNEQLVDVVYSYPVGCNSFERFTSEEHGDTLELSVLLGFFFKGQPCAHNAGVDTIAYPLIFTEVGEHYLSYQRSDSVRIVQEVCVQ